MRLDMVTLSSTDVEVIQKTVRGGKLGGRCQSRLNPAGQLAVVAVHSHSCFLLEANREFGRVSRMLSMSQIEAGTVSRRPLPLKAGPLSLSFEPDTAFLRHIRLGDHEVLRALYAAVRDEN